MKSKTLGVWLTGLSVASIVFMVLAVSDPDFEELLGLSFMVQVVFGIIGGLRLQKSEQ